MYSLVPPRAPTFSLPRLVASLAGLCGLLWLVIVVSCGSGASNGERTPWVETFDVRDTEIGPITFFARVQATGPDDISASQLTEILEVYDAYGAPRASWLDEERSTLDLLVDGARFEYAGSFVQDTLDLAEASDIPWRFQSARYRANYSARQITFRLEGVVAPETTLEIDTGEGFREVPIDEDGRYEVLVPFSQQRQVVFVRVDSGRQQRFGMIRLGEQGIEPLDEEGYREARRLAVQPRRDRIEIPVPELGLEEQNQTRPGESQEAARERARAQDRRDDQGFAPMAPFPPKVLSRPMAIDVHLVFDGLMEADPVVEELRSVLMPVGFQSDYYDAERELYWFSLRLLDLEDIRRVHRLLETYAEETGLPLVCRSRYLAVEMELVPFVGTLKTTIRGRAPSGTRLALYLGEQGEIPERRQIELDEQGRFDLEIPPRNEPILGMLTENKESVTYIELDPVTGTMNEIPESQFHLELAAATAAARARIEVEEAPETDEAQAEASESEEEAEDELE